LRDSSKISSVSKLIIGNTSKKDQVVNLIIQEAVKEELSLVTSLDVLNTSIKIRKSLIYDKEIFAQLWDPLSLSGVPLRIPINKIGAKVLAHMLDLTEVQSGVLHNAFRIASDKNLKLISFNDLRAVLKHLSDNKKDYRLYYGNASTRSINAIYRAILILEELNLNMLFTLPSIDTRDFLTSGWPLHIINTKEIINYPSVYSGLLISLLVELNECHQAQSFKKGLIILIDGKTLFNSLSNTLADDLVILLTSLMNKNIGVYLICSEVNDLPKKLVELFTSFMIYSKEALKESELKKLPMMSDNSFSGIMSMEKRLIDNIIIVDTYDNVSLLSNHESTLRISIKENSSLKAKYEKVLATDTAFLSLQDKTEENKDRAKQTRKPTPFETTLKNAAISFGKYIGNTIAKNLVQMLERKIERKD
jgi:hypothetical protein